MVAVTFDSLAIVRDLRGKGASQELAEGIADAIRVSKDTDFSHLATREELNTFKSELKADLRELANTHKTDIADVKAAIAELRAETKIDKAEIIKWMYGGFISMGGLLAAILFKLH